MMKRNGDKNKKNIKNRSITFKYVILILISMSISLTSLTLSYALTNENIKWADEGNTYRLIPTDNTITEKEYTIKVVEFPSPVRGEMKIDGGIRPERPVVPFARFELYRDIINNPNPIATFGLGIGDDYITSDKELRITIDNIPDNMSQDWVYEYYNPWVTIKTQKRAIPNLDIAINLKDTSGDSIDEDNIKPGDSIEAEISIKNTGEDAINDLNINIDPDPLLLKDIMKTNVLKDTISQLNKDEERIFDVSLKAPVYLEEKEYEIIVNTTGHDIKDAIYNFNASKKIKVKGDIEYIYVEKQVTKNTTYLKDYVHVLLNIVNTGHSTVSNITIKDAIPERLIFVKDGAVYNQTQFSFNKSSIGSSESWTIDYNLKPSEPGIYILPKLEANFSVGGKDLSATSAEVGFRVFGPKVVLSKSAVDLGNDLIEVIVKAKNIGNGFTKIIIEDNIPNNTILILGKTNLTTSLDPDVEKVMNYTIKSSEKNISNLTWSPARANYYLDDWKFNTSSDEIYEEGHIVKEGRPLEGGTKAHIIIITPVTTPTIYPEVAVPEIENNQKKVVATIPAETPIKTPEKSISGFILYDSIFSIIILLILSGVLYKNKRY